VTDEPEKTIATRFATRTVKAIRLDPRIPISKVLWLIARTVVGVLIAGVGVWFLNEGFAVYRETKDLSKTLFLTGVAFLIVGAVTASGTILIRAIMSLREPGHVIRSLIKGEAGPS
jgi:hypothetical protein